jgi:type IX secretion system PorP/SprF family membrane protein
MHKKMKFCAILFFLLIALRGFAQQDMHFSQWTSNTVLINPSAAGFSEADFRFTTHFRMQWNTLNGSAFRTNTFAFDCKPIFSIDKQSNLGIGITFGNDQTGDIKMVNNAFALPISYNLMLDRSSHFSVGISPGFVSRSIDPSAQTWDNQWNGLLFDQSVESGEKTQTGLTNFDIGAGISYEYFAYNQSFFQIGLSVNHIANQRIGYTPVNFNLFRQINAYAFGRILSYDKRYGISPQLMVSTMGPNLNILGGATFELALYQGTRRNFTEQTSFLSFGLLHRWKDAIVGVASVKIKDFKAGFSYDLNLSPLSYATRLNGGLEVFLNYGLTTRTIRRR